MVQVEVSAAELASHQLRRAMVDNQIRTFDVTDQRVLEALYLLPREKFLPDHLASLAYSDAPITLKSSVAGQDDRVMLPPLILAKLIQGGTPKATDRVLIVGGATGYAAAILGELTASVVSLDSDPAFTEAAVRALDGLGMTTVQAVTGALGKGYLKGAPYDLILVNGAVDGRLEPLLAQLATGGRLVTIKTLAEFAGRRAGKATRYDNVGGEVSARSLFDATVPVLQAFRAAPAFVF